MQEKYATYNISPSLIIYNNYILPLKEEIIE